MSERRVRRRITFARRKSRGGHFNGAPKPKIIPLPLMRCKQKSPHEKSRQPKLTTCNFNGRDDRIRTCGLIVPNDARYQTVPHPVVTRNIIRRIHPVVNIFLKKSPNFFQRSKPKGAKLSSMCAKTAVPREPREGVRFFTCRSEATARGLTGRQYLGKGDDFRLQKRSDCPQGWPTPEFSKATRCQNAASGGESPWS